MKVKAAKKIVIIEPMELSELQGNSDIVGVAVENSPLIGKVLKIGEGKKPLEMKNGDIIAYRRFGETEIFIGGKSLKFVSFDDVLGIVEI